MLLGLFVIIFDAEVFELPLFVLRTLWQLVENAWRKKIEALQQFGACSLSTYQWYNKSFIFNILFSWKGDTTFREV